MFSKLRRVLVALSLVAASSAAVKVAYAAEADGTVDLTYGSSGIASFEGAYRNTLALSDGKMVAFANVDVNSDYNPDKLEVKRFTAAGALDTSFGLSGTMSIQPPNNTYVQYGYSFADESGGFYLVYTSNDPNETGQNAGKMIKITSAGVQDLNFGTAGTAVLPAPAGSQNIGGHWIDATSNKIYTMQYGNVSAIVRQNADGTPDTTFGSNSAYIDWPYSNPCTAFWRTVKNAIWVDPTESFAYVASFIDGPNSKKAIAMAKFKFSDRSCDPTFGGDVLNNSSGSRVPDGTPDGYVEYTINNASTLSGRFTFATDGSLYTVVTDDTSNLNVVKLNSSGALDTSFNGTGISANVFSTFSDDYNSIPLLFVLPNNDVRLVGKPSSGSGIARILALSGGAVDASFGNGGIATTPSCQSLNFMGANRLADGSIIVNSVMGSGSPTVYNTYLIKLGSGGSSSQCGTTTTTTQPNYGGVPVGGGGNTCSSIGTSLTPSSRTVSGNVGEALTVPAPVAAGFSSPPTYTRVNGSYWPTGLNLDSSTGVVSGTPAMSAQYMTSSITVASGSQTCSYNITWNIATPACVTGVPTIGGTNPTLDTSFGTGGAIAFATTGVDNVLQGGVATSDGNLVVAESVEVSGDPVIKFRKYSPEGTLVSSFGTGGVSTIDQSSGTTSEEANYVAELSDGSLIALYTARSFGGMNAGTLTYLLKLTSNGAVDTSFGTNGYAAITTPYNANIRNLEVLSNDSVIVLVNSYSQMVTSNELQKFTSTGAADSTFGTSGTLTLNTSEYNFTVNSADSIFVGGSAGTSPSSATVKKYTSAGVLDTAWATSGVLTLSGLGNQGDNLSVMTVATDASNKIYVAVKASANQSINSTSKLVRLLADGTNDSSFGSGTLLSTASDPYVTGILVLADGNVVLTSMNLGMNPEVGVSLVSSSGVLDDSHATNTASLQFGNCALWDTQIAQLTTGEVMAFGATYVEGAGSGDATGSLWKLNFSGVTGGGGSNVDTPSTPATPVADTPSTPATPAADTPSTPATTAAVPTLVTSANAAALVRTPGSESIIVNGEEVVIESNTVNIPAARTPESQRTPAQVASIQQAGAALLQQFLASLPAGATSNVVVVNTATGAVMRNLVFDANGNAIDVPVEDIVFLDGPQLSLMIGSSNASITADGKYQVGAGGVVGVTGAGLGASANGEIIAMSTPTLLANFQTTAAGDFNKSATLPESIGVGDHTLVVAAGSTYALMGIRVVPGALPSTGSSTENVVIIALFTLVFGALFFRGRRTFAL